MKNKVIISLLAISLLFSLLDCNKVLAQTVIDYQLNDEYWINRIHDFDTNLTNCYLQELHYDNIPHGLLQAILISPPSNIYQVGVMHINIEDYAIIMSDTRVSDAERPNDNIKLAAARISQLLDFYGGDEYLTLVNYYHVNEEQDFFIQDVLANYYQIKGAR